MYEWIHQLASGRISSRVDDLYRGQEEKYADFKLDWKRQGAEPPFGSAFSCAGKAVQL